ncbi:MAG: citrate/2-methylcitrate synthase [Chthonomonadales bacterium]
MSSSEGSNDAPIIARGLEGVVAAATNIAEVDGEKGKLTLRGYDISELAGNVSFEEVAYLLWHGKLPNQSQLDELSDEMRKARELSPEAIATLQAVSKATDGMHVLRIGASALSIGDTTIDAFSKEGNLLRAARLQAQIPAVVAHSYRINKGLPIVHPKPEHGLAQGFLYMLEGVEPSQARVDALNAYMTAVSEHGLNASTFTGRVVISTGSDMVSAITAAICSLKGPKHGGVPGPVLKMLDEIGSVANAESFIRTEMGAGRRIMGFGHRIYKVRDPRAAILTVAAEKMAAITGDRHLLELTQAVENTTVKVLSELKPGRDLYANVELYAALILHAVGVPSEIFTPIFAIGRTSGWTAHMIEQMDETKIIRPDSVYVGPRDLKFVPMGAR